MLSSLACMLAELATCSQTLATCLSQPQTCVSFSASSSQLICMHAGSGPAGYNLPQGGSLQGWQSPGSQAEGAHTPPAVQGPHTGGHWGPSGCLRIHPRYDACIAKLTGLLWVIFVVLAMVSRACRTKRAMLLHHVLASSVAMLMPVKLFMTLNVVICLCMQACFVCYMP